MKTLNKFKSKFPYKSFRDYLQSIHREAFDLSKITNRQLKKMKILPCIACDINRLPDLIDKNNIKWIKGFVGECAFCHNIHQIELQPYRDKYVTELFIYKSNLIRWRRDNEIFKNIMKKLEI